MGNCLTEKSKLPGVVVVVDVDVVVVVVEVVEDEGVKLNFCPPTDNDGSRTILQLAVLSGVDHCNCT